jgi:EAL domain-containing protein (putative c-di-GMP-specific phosphodiesterase class I)
MATDISFSDLLADAARAAPDKAMLCVAIDLGDLRRSDRVARTLGPAYSDGLVIAAGARIRRHVGPDNPVLPVATDCFAFLLPDHGGSRQGLVGAIVRALRLPLDADGMPGTVAPAAGIVRFRAGDTGAGDKAMGAEQLLQSAIVAAQDARDADLPWRLHDASADQSARRLRDVLSGLPAALRAPDQLSLFYQPRIDMRDQACSGVEALLRWNHPIVGMIPPGEFIPVAEQTGMARVVTNWVLQRALSDLEAWLHAGFSQSVSINISAVNLAEDNFAGRLADRIAAHGIDPALVELEFTEGALVGDSPHVRATVAELAELGVGIAIDDFGTGYSNLQYLRDIPANVLKIDQSFVRELTSSARDQVIVRSMIELSHALGYRVVAEGIEDDGALSLLTEWGCDEGQGYHISRPVPLPRLRTWLAARSVAAEVK